MLGLSEPLVRAVSDQGYSTPTPIQAQAIPAVLAGGDLLAGAQTGTGKTAGFVLPMLQRLSATAPAHGKRKPIRGLVLVPTRELAAQVEASIKVYGKHLKLTSTALFGGVGFGPQVSQLRRGVDILVATPGRLLDHHNQRNVDFRSVEVFVLDEADRMLDMGFINDVRRVLAELPSNRQNLLFSATFSAQIKQLANELLDNPQTIQVAAPNSTVDMIAQRVHPVNREDKSKVLAWLVSHHRWEQVLVFTRTKHGADKLVRSLETDNIRAVALHGNKTQSARTKALADFKNGRVRVLVATDIAARGIDIDQLPHVVNFDLPNVPEDYIHRIGRTGRAGSSGEAISLVCVDERAFLRDIERLIRRTLPQEALPGFEPDPNAIAQPVFTQQRGRRPAGGGQPGFGAKRMPHRAPGSGHGAPAGGHGFARDGNGFSRDGNGASRTGHGASRSGHGAARNGNGVARDGNAAHARDGARPAARTGAQHARGTGAGDTRPAFNARSSDRARSKTRH